MKKDIEVLKHILEDIEDIINFTTTIDFEGSHQIVWYEKQFACH